MNIGIDSNIHFNIALNLDIVNDIGTTLGFDNVIGNDADHHSGTGIDIGCRH